MGSNRLMGLGILIGINVWYNPSLLPLKQLGFRLSGLYIPGLTLYPLAVVGPVVAVLIAGESIAGERIKGTLRMILTDQSPRSHLFRKIKFNYPLLTFYCFFHFIDYQSLGLLSFWRWFSGSTG